MFFTSHGTHGALITSMFTDNPFIIATGYVAGALPDVLPYFDNKNRANTLDSLKRLKFPKMDYSGWYRLFHKPELVLNETSAAIHRFIFAIIFFLHPEVDRPIHNKITGKYFWWANILAIAHIPLDIFLLYRFFFQ